VVSTDVARAGGPARSSWEAPADWVWGWSQGTGSSGMFPSINQALRGLGGTGESMPRSQEDKPFRIPKQAVWQAYEKVRRNQGAPGVDGQSLAEFETGLRGNLYKIWNRMSSGTYFPPPVRAVEIPKAHGGGTRVLGVPTVADRVAMTVAATYLETRAEPGSTPIPMGTGRAVHRADRRSGTPALSLGIDCLSFIDLTWVER
jgi:hypothetical protein